MFMLLYFYIFCYAIIYYYLYNLKYLIQDIQYYLSFFLFYMCIFVHSIFCLYALVASFDFVPIILMLLLYMLNQNFCKYKYVIKFKLLECIK